MGEIMLQFIIDHSLTILISMGCIMGLGLAIDHAMAQFESEEAEINANWRD